MERMGSVMGWRILGNILPVGCGILGVLITDMPFSVFGTWIPAPLYALMAIYYWCLMRPDLMSPVWAFLIGFLHDILSGGPPGIWAATFVATYAVTDRQRDAFAGLSGWGAILGFAIAALVAFTTQYVIICLYMWRLLPVISSTADFAVTVFLYWPVLAVLSFFHRRLVGPLRSEF